MIERWPFEYLIGRYGHRIFSDNDNDDFSVDQLNDDLKHSDWMMWWKQHYSAAQWIFAAVYKHITRIDCDFIFNQNKNVLLWYFSAHFSPFFLFCDVVQLRNLCKWNCIAPSIAIYVCHSASIDYELNLMYHSDNLKVYTFRVEMVLWQILHWFALIDVFVALLTAYALLKVQIWNHPGLHPFCAHVCSLSTNPNTRVQTSQTIIFFTSSYRRCWNF